MVCVKSSRTEKGTMPHFPGCKVTLEQDGWTWRLMMRIQMAWQLAVQPPTSRTSGYITPKS